MKGVIMKDNIYIRFLKFSNREYKFCQLLKQINPIGEDNIEEIFQIFLRDSMSLIFFLNSSIFPHPTGWINFQARVHNRKEIMKY